jgi:hypothetical protein
MRTENRVEQFFTILLYHVREFLLKLTASQVDGILSYCLLYFPQKDKKVFPLVIGSNKNIFLIFIYFALTFSTEKQKIFRILFVPFHGGTLSCLRSFEVVHCSHFIGADLLPRICGRLNWNLFSSFIENLDEI